MNLEQLKSALEKSGYSVRDGKTKTSLIIETAKGENRVAILKAIATQFSGNYTPTSSYSKQGAAIVEGKFTIYTKPAIGTVSTLDARVFTTLGDNYTMPYYEDAVKTKRFTSVQQIEKSIIKGCLSNPLLGEAVADACQQMFDDKQVDWGNTPPATINKLGVYLGEILIGWAIMSNRTKLFAGYTLKKKAKYFIIPDDPSFSGVDSFIEFEDGEKLALSSKSGAGAKASMFTNLIPNTIKHMASQPKNTSFTKFCQFLVKNGIKPTDAKGAVWTYAIRELLKLPAAKVPKPTDVQNEIKTGKGSIERSLVELTVQEKIKLAPNERDAWPYSLSVIFTKRIAELFNSDSLDQINNILQGKDYYQVNLSTKDWTKGSIKFSFTKAGMGQLKIFGDKAAVTDITAKQGWLNYEIK